MQANVILILIFAIIIALFALFNATVVTVSFIFAQIDVSLALVIIGSALIGAIIVILFDSFKKLKTKKTIKEQGKRIQTLEATLKEKETELIRKDETILQKEESLKALQAQIEAQTQSGE